MVGSSLFCVVTFYLGGQSVTVHAASELSMGWVDPRVGLGWVGLGWVGNGSKICVFSGLGWVMGLK